MDSGQKKSPTEDKPKVRQHDASSTTAPRDVLFVASLAKGFDVLETFADAPGPLLLGEIAERLGQNRSSVQRSVHTLLQIGYLEQEEGSRRLRPSSRCLEMAHMFMRCDTLVDRAWPFLVDCNGRCKETVNLSQLIQSDIILVSRLPSRRPVSVKMSLGARAPAFCTAPGRAMLAFRPEDEVAAILDREVLPRFTPFTETDPAIIRDRLDAVRQLGFAIQSEELTRGDISIAAPILSADGLAIAAVNVSVPTSRWTAERLTQEIASLIQETAQAISRTSRDRATIRRRPETFRTSSPKASS